MESKGGKMTSEQKLRLLKSKVAVALQNETGHVRKEEQIEEVTLLARVLYKAVLSVHFRRRQQQASRQLPIF
jgi:hypothetical protein